MNNKYKILLVEDDENIRIMVGAMLESSGYQVIETRTGATAMTLASSHIPDLILLDLGLPDMDGMEILEYVRKTDLVPIIVLSARSDEAEKVKAFDLGANDYMTKPFSPAELTARIDALYRRVGGGASLADSHEIYQPPFLLNTRNRTLEKHVKIFDPITYFKGTFSHCKPEERASNKHAFHIQMGLPRWPTDATSQQQQWLK